MTHGDGFVVTRPTARLIDVKNKIAGVYQIKTKIVGHGAMESVKRCSGRNRRVVYQPDLRHVDVLMEDF